MARGPVHMGTMIDEKGTEEKISLPYLSGCGMQTI